MNAAKKKKGSDETEPAAFDQKFQTNHLVQKQNTESFFVNLERNFTFALAGGPEPIRST